MNRRRALMLGGGLVVLIAALLLGQEALQRTALAGEGDDAPIFEVDPFWPKPLPNNWRIGSSIGLWVDDQDVVWMIHRPGSLAAGEVRMTADPPTAECCMPAPDVLAFDQEGNLVQAWGGPGEGYDWPESNHGIFVDHMGYVWLGGGHHILKFTRDGQFVAQYGSPDARNGPPGPDGEPTTVANSHDQENFGRIAKIFVDPVQNEVFVADGYLNRRVAVLDGDTGEMLRYWGAYGNPPDDSYEFGPWDPDAPPAPQFRSPVHCADLSMDELVYVCDRAGNRIQVFTRDGTYVNEAFFAPSTGGSGAVWDVAFSRDPEQRYLFLADGSNEKVRIILRETLQELTNFGGGGHQPGLFFGVHNVATDSQGNVYTTETFEGKRIQRFVNVGMGPVEVAEQGAPWPQQ